MRQFAAPKSLARQQDGNEVETPGSEVAADEYAPTAKGVLEGKSSTANRANGAKSDDGTRQKARGEGAASSSAGALAIPSNSHVPFANLTLPGFGSLGALSFLTDGAASNNSSSQTEQSGAEQQRGAAVMGSVTASASYDSMSALQGIAGGTAKGKSNDLSYFSADRSGTLVQPASASFGLPTFQTSVESIRQFGGASSGTYQGHAFAEATSGTVSAAVSEESKGTAAQGLTQIPSGLSGSGSLPAEIASVGNSMGAAFAKASQNATPVARTGDVGASLEGASSIRDANTATEAARSSASDHGAQTRAFAQAPAAGAGREKPEVSDSSGGTVNSGLHAAPMNPASASVRVHAEGTGADIAMPASHPLSDTVGLGPGAAGFQGVSGPSNPGAPRVEETHNSNPFLAMDGANGVAVGQSSGGGGQLTVGHQDPVLGYIELRAHSDGGGVHASLGVQSTAAGEALEGHLGSLAGWMNERQTPVESIRVWGLNSEHEVRTAFQGSNSGASGMTGGNGTGTHAGHGSSPDGGNAGQGSTTAQLLRSSATPVSAPTAIRPLGEVKTSQGMPGVPGGSSISVIA
jgi:hypothetical protein